MRIATWNINSLRLRLPSLQRVVAALKPDIICLQEIKVEDALFPEDGVKALGFDHMLYRGMKGYNGVAILSRVPITEIPGRQWCGKDDCRHLAATLPDGTELHNFYVPAGGDIPDPVANEKFAHKLNFIAEMADWFKAAGEGSRILVGDLNIAPLENDVWSHKQLLKIVSHTPEEVDGLNHVMAQGWLDAVREFIPPDEALFTWWSYRNRTWPGTNRGRRLDHIWVTTALKKQLQGTEILHEARGWERPSDHVPVAIDLDITA